MRCPWYLFHRLFCVWARTQGPHDPLLPGGPMSCQSAPVSYNGPFHFSPLEKQGIRGQTESTCSSKEGGAKHKF
ncbi:unnamed protein product, partial [Staurois parvus]